MSYKIYPTKVYKSPMDIVINAAVQSPLFRNLAHIPSDRLAFSHHISSNAPPLSKTKITVEPETAHNSLDADYKFRIPQFGYLNKVIIKLEYDIYPVTRFQVTPLLPMYHLINEISLRSHHRPIQTVFGKEILLKHCYWSDTQDGVAKIAGTLNIPPEGTDTADLREMFKTNANGTDSLWNPYDTASWTTNKRRITFFVEVPFASTSAPHVNFDTRFVEHLDVYVRLNSASANKPLGMACGQMEVDLSQSFNNVIGERFGTADKTQIFPVGAHVTAATNFFGTVPDETADITECTTSKSASTTDLGVNYRSSTGVYTAGGVAVVGSQNDHLAITGEYARFILAVSDSGTWYNCTQLEQGDTLYTRANFNTSADPIYNAIGTIERVFQTVAGSSSGGGNHINSIVLREVKNFALANLDGLFVGKRTANFGISGSNGNYVTGTLTNNTSQANLDLNYAVQPSMLSAAVGGQGKRTGHPGAIADLSQSTEFHSVAGILKFNKPGLNVALQGPVTTVVNDNNLATVLADTGGSYTQVPGCKIGNSHQPFTPVNWVRIGCTSYTASDYDGWGYNADTAAKPYDYFTWTAASTTTTNAESDARDNGTIQTDLAGAKFHGQSADASAAAFTGDDGKIGSTFVTSGYSSMTTYTQGSRWKDAVLERYYTVFPHLRQASGTVNSGTNAWAGAVGTGAAWTMADPALTGGKSGAASGILEGASNISTQYPMNITCSLLCTFLNYHDKIREDISLENYKDDQPATILAWDCVNEIEDALYGAGTSSYATQPFQEMILPIKSNHLAYAISVIAFRDLSSAELSNSQARDATGRSVSVGDESYIGQHVIGSSTVNIGTTTVSAPRCSFPCYEVVENFKTVLPTYVAIKGSGRPLYEAGTDSTAATNGVGGPFNNWTTSGKKGRGLGCAAAEADLDNLSYNYNTVEGKGSLQGASSFSDQLLAGANRTVVGDLSDHTSAHIISFGLNPTDQLANSGCLALQTVNNPTLHLRFPERYALANLKICRKQVERTAHQPLPPFPNTGAAFPSSFTTTRSFRSTRTPARSPGRSTSNHGGRLRATRHETHVRADRHFHHQRTSTNYNTRDGNGGTDARLHRRTKERARHNIGRLGHWKNGPTKCHAMGRLLGRNDPPSDRPFRHRFGERDSN